MTQDQPVSQDPGPGGELVVSARNREVALAAAFADLAGGLVGEVDVPDLLSRLAEHCVGLLAASGCGILLTDPAGTLRLLAAAPEATEVLEVFQLQASEGPGVDCARTGEPVRSRDLTVDSRWPRWTPQAVTRGIRSVYATPLRTPDAVIGTLTLFGVDVDGLSEADLLIVRALADVATLTLLQQRDTAQATELSAQLQTALASRIVIEQATGFIAHAFTVTTDNAFTVLRYTARSVNTKLTVLAEALLTGQITATDLLRPPPRT